MKALIDYIINHTERGECQCGKCCDKGPDRTPSGHSVDVHFFWVSAKNSPKAQELSDLLAQYPIQERLAGGPSYIEMGAALGSQNVALRLIGLGELTGLWKVVTPARMHIADKAVADELAGSGLVMCTGHKPTLSERSQSE